MMAHACRGCGAALANPSRWGVPQYCSSECGDRHLDRIMIAAMGETRVGRPPAQPRGARFCPECGADIPAGHKKRFCGDQCRADYNAAQRSSA